MESKPLRQGARITVLQRLTILLVLGMIFASAVSSTTVMRRPQNAENPTNRSFCNSMGAPYVVYDPWEGYGITGDKGCLFGS